jgi:hypothetical protein
LIIDEAMCAYKGIEMVMKHASSIHITKIKRKPKGVGIEVKCIADGGTAIILNTEIQEGNLATEVRLFEGPPDNLPFHTAVVLRQALPWIGRCRSVKGDSAFSSYRTAVECLKRGLNYCGPVKQCNAGFPKAYLEAWARTPDLQIGSYKVVKTVKVINAQERIIIGLGWLAKKDCLKMFISTYSTTLPGAPHIINRVHREIQDGVWQNVNHVRNIPRPRLVEEVFDEINAIDLNDRYRQGYLQMEMYWRTESWWVRLFTTFLGMDFTDCYLAYKFEYLAANGGDETGLKTMKTFLGELSWSLVYNFDRPGFRPQRNNANLTHDQANHRQGLMVCLILYIDIRMYKLG